MHARRLPAFFGAAVVALAAVVHTADAASISASDVPMPEARPLGLGGLSPTDAAWRSTLSFANDGDWERAATVRGRNRDPVLESVLDWMRLRDEDRPASFDAIERFLHAHPGWPSEDTLVTEAEARIDDTVDLARRLEWFATHPPRSTRGRLAHLAALAEADGDETVLRDAVRETWRRIEFGRRDKAAFLKRYGRHLRESDHIDRLDALLWRGRAGAARQTMGLVPEGWRRLADARIRLRYREAGVDAAVKRVPADLQDNPGLMYERLRWRRLAGMRTAARELMLEAPPAEAFVRLWWRERAWHIRDALESADHQDAYLLAASHSQTSGAAFAEAEWLAGWIALRFLDRPEDALRHFSMLHANVSTPISSARAAYWAGRAAEALGRSDEARDWYAHGAAFQTTFYGQLAAARIGASRISLPEPAAPDDNSRNAFDADDRVQASRALIRLRLDGLARLFLRHLAVESADMDRSALIAETAAEAGELGTAVFTARRAAVGRMVLPALGYPVLDGVPAGGPEPALVHAIIRQESSFETTAISRVGARGLMQLMPATARSTAKSLGLDYDLGSLIARPDYNMRLGSTYLKRMVDRFDGHYIKAIAAYNAGPSRVERWVSKHGDPGDPGVDVIDWIERIPFSETRNYVQRVLEAMHVYRDRLTGDRVQTTYLAGLTPGAREVWCVYSCGVLLDRQQAALQGD